MNSMDMLIREMFRYALDNNKEKLYETADIINNYTTNNGLSQNETFHFETKAGLEIVAEDTDEEAKQVVVKMLSLYYLHNQNRINYDKDTLN